MILVDTSVLIDFFKGNENEPCKKFETIPVQEATGNKKLGKGNSEIENCIEKYLKNKRCR